MIKTLLLIHGANLNYLGQRDKNLYGALTLEALENFVKQEALKKNFNVVCYHSNHEGCLIDALQHYTLQCQGILINPGAFTHYSYALHDALVDTRLPVIEVHLSDIDNRESWRKNSVIRPACLHAFFGKKQQSYQEALYYLIDYLDR